jgi:ABC-type polysaccharide/polyol phosphate export permease
MKAIVVRIASALTGIFVVTVGLIMARGEFFFYSSELHSLSPPPTWKSIVIVGLLLGAVIAPCWLAYRLIRYAIRRVGDSK